jgi:hypothetical protein
MMQLRTEPYPHEGDCLLTGRHATVKTTNYPQNLENLAEWNELFQMEADGVEPESPRKIYVKIDLGLDQMEDYEST